MNYFKIDKKDNQIIINSKNSWSMYKTTQIQKEIDDILHRIDRDKKTVLNLNGIEDMDTVSAILLDNMIDSLSKKTDLVVIAKDEKQDKFLKFINNLAKTQNSSNSSNSKLNLVQKIGKYFIDFFKDFFLFISFIGESSISFANYILHPSKIRIKSIVKGIESAGVNALPIVALTSFLVGIVIAYQSAVQLQKFGANIFIVDMIGISVTRELAPLITAIVVAGRSGSSYTAQIGAQKITRELDAMKTMGFDLFEFLVLPRIIALMIALPLMIFFADMIGIFGGMVVAKYQMDISYMEFIKRLQGVLPLKHLWIGLSKGPFFAILIAGIGCFRGFQVKNNTESIGRYTTISVVNSIFLVIACDALFSIIFTKLGV